MNAAIIISTVAVFFSYLSKRGFQYGLETAMLILTTFIAFRFEWGTDMPSYLRMYDMFSESGYHFWEISKISDICYRSNEVGWGVLNVMCKPIGFFGMTIVLAITENIIIYDTIKRYVRKNYYWLAVFLYAFNANLMVLSCSMMRQWLAMCIVLFSIRQIISANIVRFLILVALASVFHQSAIIFSCLYLVRFLKREYIISLKYLPFLIVGIILWIFAIGQRLEGLVVSFVDLGMFDYQSEELQGKGASVGIMVICNIFILLLCLYLSYKRDVTTRLLCCMSCVYIIIIPFVVNHPLIGRLLFYSDVIAMFSIPSSMKYLHSKNIKTILITVIIIQQLYLYNLFFKSDSYRLPYQNYRTIIDSPQWK